MIEGKRLKNYMVYAVGEIILLVVGIMIAVGMNNWKQEQADQKELERIIRIVKTDLEADLVETNEVLNSSQTGQKLTAKILYSSTFKDSIRDCEECRYIMAAVYVPNFQLQWI